MAGTWKPNSARTDKERIITLEAHYEQMNRRQGKRNNSANEDNKAKGKDKKNKYE
jgi:hypothetical protein